MNKTVELLGRILIAFIFLMSAFNKITNFEATQAYMTSKHMPMTGLLLVGAILLILPGSLSLMLGYKTKWGAVMLFVFLAPATLIFHNDFADQNQLIHFMKNLAIMGGLLMVFSHGPGACSLDARKKPAPNN